MSAEYGANRWWENYLVRYLMPSIAGVVVVNWLCSHGGDGFRSLLLLPPAGLPIDASSLTLLFLYGNLFCYVASYPVLVFHATRVMDFTRTTEWRARRLVDGYATALLVSAAVLFVFRRSAELRFWIAFVFVIYLTVIQMWRMYLVLSPRVSVEGIQGAVSPAFGYVYALSRRRGILERSITSGPSTVKEEGGSEWTDEWRKDFISTYRHLREHGNSAFIFIFEIMLAGLVYCVIMKPGLTPLDQLSAVGTLLFIWAAPAVLVHLLGQHLERRFSQFDMRTELKAPEAIPNEGQRRDV